MLKYSKMSPNFKEAYRTTLEYFPGVKGASMADEYVSQVEATIDKAIKNLDDLAGKNLAKNVAYLKGDLAEPWHVETLKIDAARRELNDVWAHAPRNHGPIDTKHGTATEAYNSQIKIYNKAEETTKAISRPDYGDMDQKVVASDQLNEVIDHSRRLMLRDLINRPEQAAQYQHTAETATDHLKAGKAESRPISEPEMKQIATEYKRGEFDPKKHNLTPESFIQIQDIIRESMEAAAHAAVITATLKAAPHIYIVVDRLIRTGEVNTDDVQRVGIAAFQGAADGALRGIIAAGLTGACRSGLLGASFKSAHPSAIAAGTVIAINSSKYAVAMARGQITPDEFAAMCVRDTVIISCGVLGATAGQAIIPVPVLGALVGNFVGSILGTAAHAGAREVYYGLAVEEGWTFWGLVKQDYEVPGWVLERAGFDVVQVCDFEIGDFEIRDFQVGDFNVYDNLGIVPLKRGVIKCNVVGYLSA